MLYQKTLPIYNYNTVKHQYTISKSLGETTKNFVILNYTFLGSLLCGILQVEIKYMALL